MPSIEIISDHPSMVALNVHYVRVNIEGHPSVLLRESYGRWLHIDAKSGDISLAATQKQAAERALGIELPNWRD